MRKALMIGMIAFLVAGIVGCAGQTAKPDNGTSANPGSSPGTAPSVSPGTGTGSPAGPSSGGSPTPSATGPNTGTPPAPGQPTAPANSFEKYIPLIGMTKEKVAETLGDKPRPVDEGGQEFPKAGIRVWFDDKSLVREIWMPDKSLDFKGAAIGGKIENFLKVFGTPVLRDMNAAYANFAYKGLVLHVVYDPKTEVTIAAYLLKEWK